MAEDFTQGNIGWELLVSDSQQTGELGFEMAEGTQTGSGGIDMIEGTGEEIVQRRVGVLRLDGGFEELPAIGGEEGGGVLAAEALPPVDDGNLAEGVEFSPAGVGEIDFPAKKEIEFPGERAFRSQCSFCHGLDETVIRRKPVDDETGIRQSGEAGEDSGHGVR